MYSESYREEILYNAQQTTPALSSYFELMDRYAIHHAMVEMEPGRHRPT